LYVGQRSLRNDSMTVSVATPTWVAPSPMRPSTERSTPRVPAVRDDAATSAGSPR
jgi:hypothetical protein